SINPRRDGESVPPGKGSQGCRALSRWRRGPQGGTSAQTGHFGARHSDAGKRRPGGAPGDEKRATAYASRGSHRYARRRRTDRGGPSRRARPRAQGAGAEAARAVHPESACGRTVAGEALGEQRAGKTAPARDRKKRGRSDAVAQRNRNYQTGGGGATQYGDRQETLHQRGNGQDPSPQHLSEARRR